MMRLTALDSRPANLVGRGSLGTDDLSASDKCNSPLDDVNDVRIEGMKFAYSGFVPAPRPNPRVLSLAYPVQQDGPLRKGCCHFLAGEIGGLGGSRICRSVGAE